MDFGNRRVGGEIKLFPVSRRVMWDDVGLHEAIARPLADVVEGSARVIDDFSLMKLQKD